MAQIVDEKTIPWLTEGTLGERLEFWQAEASDSSRLVVDESLSRHCSLRIGGPAAFWIEVGNVTDLWSLLGALGDEPYYCVGLGSNTLFPDEGIEGVVIRLVDELAQWSVTADGADSIAPVEVMAGAINAHLVRGLLRSQWVGAEFLSLIPGTFGGAVALNAGTREKELAAIIESVWLATPDSQKRCWTVEKKPASALAMGYRRAELAPGSLVIGGVVRVERGDVELARARVKADKERRNQTQPYRLASVGSTFANPPGDYAGRLIEAVGLKGQSVGGARISSLHANFFINEDGATAEDFLRLMALARHRVRRDFGIELRPEVKFVGFDGRSRMSDLERELEDRDV